jgi:hypothetical protein
MRIDYGYRRNGTRGFVQTLSVSRSPGDVKLLAYTFERIRQKVQSSRFTAVTDVKLVAENERHKFVQETLRDAGVEAMPLEGSAVWVAKLRPQIQCVRRVAARQLIGSAEIPALSDPAR